jgi:hypothetical protein
MAQRPVIWSSPQAHAVIKEMNLSAEWESDCRKAARGAVVKVFEQRMRNRIDGHLEEIARAGESDRRNGTYSRHLLTELGEFELQVPRTRRVSGADVLRMYARRVAHVSRPRRPRPFPGPGTDLGEPASEFVSLDRGGSGPAARGEAF